MAIKRTVRKYVRKATGKVASLKKAVQKRYAPAAYGKRIAEKDIKVRAAKKKVYGALVKYSPPAVSWRMGRAGGKYIRKVREARDKRLHQEKVKNWKKSSPVGKAYSRLKKAWGTRRTKYGKKGKRG